MYNNRALVPGPCRPFQRWMVGSLVARAQGPAAWTWPMAAARWKTLDVFPTARPGAPVLVFIHGGGWRSLDKADHSFVAPAFTRQGACVVVPNYARCVPGGDHSPDCIADGSRYLA